MQAAIPFIILGLYSIINLAEAWLEEVVIELKDPRLSNYDDLNNKEHFRSLVYAILVCVPFLINAWFYHLYFLFPALIINRRIFFDHLLKVFRGKPVWAIEGNGPFDSFFRMIYGKRGGWYELISEAVITTVSIILSIQLS